MPTLKDAVQTTEPKEITLLETMLADVEQARRLKTFAAASGGVAEFSREHPDYDRVLETEERIEQHRAWAFEQSGGGLPDSLLTTMLVEEGYRGLEVSFGHEDRLTLAARAEKTDTAELRRIGEALGFPIMPLEYLNAGVIDMAGKGKKNLARKFAEEMSEDYDVYALAPMGAYDVINHMQAEKNLAVWVPESNQLMSATLATVPALRVLWKTQKEQDGRMTEIEKDLSEAKQELSRLEARVAEGIRQQALENESLRQRIERVRRLRRASADSFSQVDPLAFAVLKGTNIFDGSHPAVLGPCWGPEFEDIVFEALGLR